MQITEQIYAKKMLFHAVTPAGTMERTVYVYLVAGGQASFLVDTGVYPCLNDVLEFIKSTGKKPEDIGEILITHAHADHIGSLKSLKERLGCKAAASERSTPWIEDVDRQFRERPVPNFNDFVEGSAKIERKIKDGDIIELGGSSLTVYEAPGHEKGQLTFFHRQDGVLFAADSIPIPGELPVYDDLSAEISTLQRLREIEGVKVLLMSWDDPHKGSEVVRQVFNHALDYIRKIHSLTLEGIAEYGAVDVNGVAKYVHNELRLPPSTFTKLFTDTVKAHVKEAGMILNI